MNCLYCKRIVNVVTKNLLFKPNIYISNKLFFFESNKACFENNSYKGTQLKEKVKEKLHILKYFMRYH